MSTTINFGQLRHELARRGWSHTDLARAAGVSHATVSAACRGRPVSSTTLRLIAHALAKTPAIAEIDSLLL